MEEREQLEHIDKMIQQLAHAGDFHGAWLLAYETYWDKIAHSCYRRLYAHVHDVVDATWDVTADTFVDFREFLARHRGEWSGKARAQLYTIARNKCIDLQRRRYRSPINDWVDPDDVLHAAPEPTPEQRVAHKQAMEDLREAICQLPPLYRDVLNAMIELALSPEEITAMLGIKVGNARARVTRAVQKLCVMLRGDT